VIAIMSLTLLFEAHLQEQRFVGRLSRSNDGESLKLYVRNLQSTTTTIYRPDASSFVVSCASCTLRWPSPKMVVQPLQVAPVKDYIPPFSCKLYLFSFHQLVPTRHTHKLTISVVDETPEMFLSYDPAVRLFSTRHVQPIRLSMKNYRALE
jgi:hypothetical protein